MHTEMVPLSIVPDLGIGGDSEEKAGDHPQYGESRIEWRTRKAIDAQNDDEPLTPGQWALAETCLALAANIAAGNRKGRAIANEANQLSELMAKLAGEDIAEAADNMPPEAKRIFDALSAPPTADSSAERYAPEP